jgi:hypothetical protein
MEPAGVILIALKDIDVNQEDVLKDRIQDV